MAKPVTDTAPLRVAALPKGMPVAFDLVVDAAARAAIAQALGIVALRKLSFRGTLSPLGRHDWQLMARLGATAVQSCVVSLEPVTTRIDTDVTRRYRADMPSPAQMDPTPKDGVEMPDDDTQEPLGDVIDLIRVAQEALALALPDYPRADGAAPAEMRAAPPGATPMTDAEVKPFAGLAGLKDKLDRGE